MDDAVALEPTEKIAAVYARPFKLSYVLTLAEHQLSTNLHVKNTSTSGVLEFQALFHNYIRAPSKDVLITPLQHTSYYDKTESTEEGRITPKVETRASVDVEQFTDSVYDDVPQTYQVTWPGGGVELRSTNLKNLVVWNPQAEAGRKIGDMEEGGWYVHVYNSHFLSHEGG
jgi:glucose-6-phosphate 1-epimerase